MKHSDVIKNHLTSIIEDICAQKEKYVYNPEKDFTRDRKLPLEKVINLILSMKGNTLNKELYDFFGKDPNEIVTSSAFVQQRNKIKPEMFIDLFHKANDVMSQYDTKTYKGYKIYAVDGSDINVAYDKNADTYINNRNSSYDGYNQYHLNALYDLLNKVYVNTVLIPRPTANERTAFLDMLYEMNINTKTLFIADRGYPSWNIFAHFKYKNNADFLIRVKNSEYTAVKNLPMDELDIDYSTIVTTKSTKYKKDRNYTYISSKPKKSKNNLSPETRYKQWDFGTEEEISVRIVRFKITDDSYETIFTSLPRDKFSIQDIKELYAMRWGIETSFRELKYVIGLTNLHSKKDDFVRQEIFAKLIMYNFAERIISSVVIEQDECRKYTYQINYTMGIQICLDFYRCVIEDWDLYELLTKYILPVRPGRKDKRKLKAKNFVYFLYRVAA